MFVVQIAVETSIEKVEIQRAGFHNIQFREDRVIIGDSKYAILIIVFEITEPEQAVL